MENTPLDIILWKTAEESTEDNSSSKDFEFFFQNQNVGKASMRLCKNTYGLFDNKRFFPNTWFYEDEQVYEFYGRQAPLKPFLEITNFDFSNFQGKGFGRMGLQLMYQLSQKSGAEGRIFLTAQKKETSLREPAPFYEHCGFKGYEGIEGKYFEPSPETLQQLFSKQAHPLFIMREIPIRENENSFIDLRTGKIKIPPKLKNILTRQRD